MVIGEQFKTGVVQYICMVEIRYLGHAAFYVKTKRARVVFDPFPPAVGFKMKRVEADVVFVSHSHFDHSYIEGVEGDFVVVVGPGEYEVKGIKAYGFATYHDSEQGNQRGENTVYLIQVEGFNLVHLGDLGHPLDDKIVEALGEVDVLFIPVGGFYTLELPDVVKVIEQIEPKVIIPMHYRTSQHSSDFAKIAPLELFLQEMGVKEWQSVDKLVLKKETELGPVVVMNRWK